MPASEAIVSEKQTDKPKVLSLHENDLFHNDGFVNIFPNTSIHRESLNLLMYRGGSALFDTGKVMQVSVPTSLVTTSWQSETEAIIVKVSNTTIKDTHIMLQSKIPILSVG